MGIVSNLTVYALMVLPIAMMLRGHSIHFSRLLKLAMTCLVVQLAESLLISAAPTSRAMITTVHGLIMPVIQTAFFTFAMHDHKALKIFRLRDGGDGDVAAVLSTTWCLIYTVLYRWIGWYRTASSLGYEMDNIISAADAFLTLVGALAAARHIQGGSEESTSTARLSASLAIILGSALAGTVVSLMVPAMPLVGAAVTTTLLVVAPKVAADDTKKGD